MRSSRKEQVWKLKEYIWKSFQSSGKKHLFLTGKRQIGKTTIMRAILEQDMDYGGIVTRAVRGEQYTPDYILLEDFHDVSINSVVGRRNQQGNGMIPCLEGFEKTGVWILNRCLSNEAEWIVIDEIGFLENGSSAFQETIRTCLREKRVIAVLRKESTPFLEELYAWEDALLVDLDNLNENGLCMETSSVMTR